MIVIKHAFLNEALLLKWMSKEASAFELTGVFDGDVGHQEILFAGGVFAVVAFEGLVVGVGQLVVQQLLLVVTGHVTELTLKPEPETKAL